jgi:hypothetical protein
MKMKQRQIRLVQAFLTGLGSVLDVFGAGMSDARDYRPKPLKSVCEAMADDARKLREDAKRVVF